MRQESDGTPAAKAAVAHPVQASDSTAASKGSRNTFATKEAKAQLRGRGSNSPTVARLAG